MEKLEIYCITNKIINLLNNSDYKMAGWEKNRMLYNQRFFYLFIKFISVKKYIGPI
jgi:hypothetical protein